MDIDEWVRGEEAVARREAIRERGRHRHFVQVMLDRKIHAIARNGGAIADATEEFEALRAAMLEEEEALAAYQARVRELMKGASQ